MPLSDFTIGKVLGKGTFGSVCIVHRKIDNQTYAMKSVKMIQLTEKEKQNALNEIRILASLNHKNIIGYKEAFFDEESQTLNIIMEYADDGDLSTKIKYNLKNGLIFHESIIWNYLIQILEGINYLHENKVIHRDLKSANLFLMNDGTVKIGDLNVSTIAKMGIAFTQTGTPYYASPEVWMDKSYNNKSDIWSIGCISYELCMLKPPFRGTSMKNLCKNIQRGVYEQINNIYSDDLKKIISLMLVVNPDKRLSAKELLMSDFVVKRSLRENGAKKFFQEEKADLIKTIKMPRNLREINRSLPMKRYNKIQKEEMLMNDEYETKKNGFFNNDEEMKEVKNFLEDNKHKQHNVNNNNNYQKNNNNNNNNNNYNYNNYNNYYNHKNYNVKNPWDNDNIKNNYEHHYHQQIINNPNNNNQINNYHYNNNNYLHNNNNKQMGNNQPYNRIKNIEMINNIHNYNYNYNSNNNNSNNNEHRINIINNNNNNNNNSEHPKTPNLVSPYNNKYKYNNIYGNNNNYNNGRKVEVSSKSRPSTGNNIIHQNNNNRINRANIKNVNLNNINMNNNINYNNNNKKPSRPISSAAPHRGGYMYRNNNNNNIVKSNNNNNKSRPNTGNPNNRIINIQRNMNNNNMRQYQNNYNNNKLHHHNLNNDFKLRNGKDIVMGNNKKKKVVIEKINYKPSKQNYNNIYGNNKYSNNNNQNVLRGKNDRMKEYEKERLKNLNNQNHVYNYRNYVKK